MRCQFISRVRRWTAQTPGIPPHPGPSDPPSPQRGRLRRMFLPARSAHLSLRPKVSTGNLRPSEGKAFPPHPGPSDPSSPQRGRFRGRVSHILAFPSRDAKRRRRAEKTRRMLIAFLKTQNDINDESTRSGFFGDTAYLCSFARHESTAHTGARELFLLYKS